MKMYEHNGEKVIFQTVSDQLFLDGLYDAGIVPEEVSEGDLRYRVFKYGKDGKVTYAVVLATNATDTYLEKVYITEKVPEDGFWHLVEDVDAQREGEEPKKIPSRLKLAIDKAEEDAEEWIRANYPEKTGELLFMTEYPDEVAGEKKKIWKMRLSEYGYDLDVLKKIKVTDVDMDFVRELLK